MKGVSNPKTDNATNAQNFPAEESPPEPNFSVEKSGGKVAVDLPFYRVTF
jgi:hypothetical protein